MKNIYESFTNLYSLSRTLRFELVPIGKTRENMNIAFRFDKDMQTFLYDQKKENAYQTLKPVLDSLHERFITESLQTRIAKSIDVSAYFEVYKNRKERSIKDLEKVAKQLRSHFADAYKETANAWKERAGTKDNGKPILTKSGYSILTENAILTYLSMKINEFKNDYKTHELKKAIKELTGFFTYLSGFNQNRENYYETDKEAKTAVATRIVNENLPRFCDNIIVFQARKVDYCSMYGVLTGLNKTLVRKDGSSLTKLKEEIFDVSYYPSCLTQKEIEAYNDAIGNANALVNLFNQAHVKQQGFKKLPLFKTLYKQIGCGKRKYLFETIETYSREEREKRYPDTAGVTSLEEVIHSAIEQGKKFFSSQSDSSHTVKAFIKYLENREDLDGIYWSKAAINTISNRYFSNWHDIADRLKQSKIFTDTNPEKDGIPEAVELSAMFNVLDTIPDWKEGMFRESLLKDSSKNSFIQSAETPSRALLMLILSDLKKHAETFISKSEDIAGLHDLSTEENKKAIKDWMDHALAVTRILRYFRVREEKTKGHPVDATITEYLDALLYNSNWFDWYNMMRNFLTRKPADKAKENRLKLNFENGSLLGGWSDGQEKSKGAVILKKDDNMYLGVLKKKNLFDTEKPGNPIYQTSNENAGRLILANLKFQTLAGKGFLGKYGISYGEMGKSDPMKAVSCLQEIIKERYAKKYPLLAPFVEKKYDDKKTFDKEIQLALAESYVCEFAPINWDLVETSVNEGNLYLFQIKTKDNQKNTSRKDLQYYYWQAVFQQPEIVQLNGGGEIFYRRKMLDKAVKKKGYEKKDNVIVNKRYTKEIFQFHCPIKLNYKAKSYKKPQYALPEVNARINTTMASDPSTTFLGIDRGEKHLAYYAVVDRNGNLLEQSTLNMPFKDKDGKSRKVIANRKSLDDDGHDIEELVECEDYNDLLEARAGNRDFARKNWQEIGSIKELKEGYISQVVRVVADLALKHQSYIVLEDLNTGFKRGRQKIEKSVYQKLELALAKKLNFLVNKDAKDDEIGSVAKALQLTPPVSNYQDIENKKQVGVMLYARANYTSLTDPVTGWRKKIYLKKGSEEVIRAQILEMFADIKKEGNDYCFTYKDSLTGIVWKLYSGKNGVPLERYRGQRDSNTGKWKRSKVDVVEILDAVFANFDKTTSLKHQLEHNLAELNKYDKNTAWESLRFAIDVIQQIRNTGVTERDSDYILSPVRDSEGNHFDSRMAQTGQPTSGDANGAYNIARKGIIMNEHIQRGLTPYVSDEEWDCWLVGSKCWEQWLSANKASLIPKKSK